MKMYEITNIDYDTDGEEVLGLPTSFVVPENVLNQYDCPADYVSDETGFCINSCELVITEDDSILWD